MENVNIGHIFAWLLVAFGIGGYLFWKVSTDSRAKKKATALRDTVKPCEVTVVSVERSCSGLAAIVVDCLHLNGETRKERFVPKSLTSEIDAVAIDVGERGNLYAENFEDGSVAWLDVTNFSSYGRLGYPVG